MSERICYEKQARICALSAAKGMVMIMKISKKTVSLLLVFSILLTCFCSPVFTADTDEDGYDDETGEYIGGDMDGIEVILEESPEPADTSPEPAPEAPVVSTFFSDIPAELSIKAALLDGLGIIPSQNDKFEPSKAVSAGHFVTMTAHFLSLDEDVVKQQQRDRLAVITNKAYNLNNEITLKDAASLMALVLSYDATRPKGYDLYQLAAENKLLAGMDNEDYQVFTRKTALILLYNSLNAPMIVVTGTANGEYRYEKSNDTPLAKYHKVYRKTGVVTGRHETRLTDRQSSLLKDEVSIDESVYKTGKTAVRGLLGQRVEFFYQYNPDVDERAVLVAAGALKSNDAVTITNDLYAGTIGASVRYYERLGSERERTLLFDTSFGSVIFNGKRVPVFGTEGSDKTLADRLSDFDSATFLDNDDDGKFDVCLISKSLTLVVKSVDASSETVSLEIPIHMNKNSYSGFQSKDTRNVVSIVKNEKEISLRDIKPGDILTVTDSSVTNIPGEFSSDAFDFISAQVTSEKVRGEITVITFGSGSPEYTINDQKYTLSKSYQEYIGYPTAAYPHSTPNPAREFALSEKGEFYLDADMKIAFAVTNRKLSSTFLLPENINPDHPGGTQYGYLFHIGMEGGLVKKPKIELLTMANKFRIFDVADKMEITYYPFYAPYANYSAASVSKTPIGAYQRYANSNVYRYLDPVVNRKINSPAVLYGEPTPQGVSNSNFDFAFSAAYPDVANTPAAAAAQKQYFQDGYGAKERGENWKILDKYFNANVNGLGQIAGNFVFDLEKMQIVRYTLNHEGKIDSIETAKDYGIPYQWQHQNVTYAEREQDINGNVFTLSAKAQIARNSTTGAGAMIGRYRYDANSGAFFEQENLESQSPLFFLKASAYQFVVPVLTSVPGFYFDNNVNNIENLHKMRREKFRYKVEKVNLLTNNYLVNAYNVNALAESDILLRYQALDNVSGGNIRVLVDSVNKTVDADGMVVQSLVGYGLASGRLNKFTGTDIHTFERKAPVTGAPPGESFTGSYKRGDIILIGRGWQTGGIIMSEPRFLYDGPENFRFNNYLAGDLLASTTKSTRDPHGAYFALPTIDYDHNGTPQTPVSIPGTLNSVVKYAKDFNFSLPEDRMDYTSSTPESPVPQPVAKAGYYFPIGIKDTNMYTGDFAGRISEIGTDKLKLSFRDSILSATDRNSRLDQSFIRVVSPNVKVYDVTVRRINVISADELEVGDFIQGYVVKNLITQIIRYQID